MEEQRDHQQHEAARPDGTGPRRPARARAVGPEQAPGVPDRDGVGTLRVRPSPFTRPVRYKQATTDTLINQRERLRALGYVHEQQAVGPRGEQRWAIAGHHRAQAIAYQLGLIGGSTRRTLDDANSDAMAIVDALEAEPDYVVALAVELTSGTRDFATALAVARQATN